MIFILLLIPLLSFADIPYHWSSAISISDKHEFYQNNEIIKKPANSWQTLFGVVYPDGQINLQKDCVFYRVPGSEDGELKIKKIDVEESCETKIESPGDISIKNLRALQFEITEKNIALLLTQSDYRVLQWNFSRLNNLKKAEVRESLSSSEFKASKILFLAPVDVKAGNVRAKRDDKLCHAVSDDCEVMSPSTCHECSEGWFEAPNGCMIGPKYCGFKSCGGKNQPACRRGIKYQRKRKKFECRRDSSFAYCSSGHTIQCVGAEAWCR
jgi:hypothetical protein